MCSRYFLDADGNIIAYTFRVPPDDRIRKRFNIAPTQDAPVIRTDSAGNREVAILRWGLVPSWSKDLASGTKMVNVRAVTRLMSNPRAEGPECLNDAEATWDQQELL